MSLGLPSTDGFEHKNDIINGRKLTLTIRGRTGPESDDKEAIEGENTKRKKSNYSFKGCPIDDDDDDHWKRDGPLDEITICEIRKRFDLDSTTCVANRLDAPVRCRNRIARPNQQSAREMFERTNSERPPSDEEEYGIQLSRMTHLIFCQRNHKGLALWEINSWLSKVAFKKAQAQEKTTNKMTIKSELRSPNLAEILDTKLTRRSTSQRKHGEVGYEEEVQKISHSAPKKSPRRESLGEAVEPPPGFIHIRVQSFRPYVPSKYKNYSVEEIIEDTLSRNLTGRERKKIGHIYMYSFSGAPRRIKIGVTTTSTQERLKKWEAQCGRKVDLLYSTQFDVDEVAIPHCYRVEALVHAELALYRKKIPICPGCGKCHREWFEVDPEYIKATIRRWADWIQQKPYEQVGLEYPRLPTDKPRGTIWRLKSTSELSVTSIRPPLRTDREPVAVATGHESIEILVRRNSRLAKRL